MLSELIKKSGGSMLSVGKSVGKMVLALSVVGLLLPIVATGADSQNRNSLNGYTEFGYRYRSDGNDTDQDLIESLSLDYFRPWGESSEVGFVFYGLLQQDIDDHPSSGEFDPFREASDTYRDSAAGWLYMAYGEYSSTGFVKTMRLGRQDVIELEPVAFDGGLLTLQANKRFSLTAFGGVPTNIFEENGGRQGDSVAGAYVDWRPMRNVAVILGYLNLRDELELLDGTEKTLQEDLVIGHATWRVNRNTSLTGRSTTLDDEFRDATVRYSYQSYERDLRVTAYYYQLFITREAESFTEDPFRSEEHTSELQSHSFISYAVFCLKKKNNNII